MLSGTVAVATASF